MAGDAPKPALITARPTTEESKWAGKECPWCHKPIEPGQTAVLCPKCYTPQHRDCWTENGNKCALDGTPANILDRSPRAAAPAAGAAAVPAGGAAPVAPAAPVASTGAVAAAGETAQPAVATAVAPATVAAAAETQTTATAAAAAGAAGAVARPAAAAARPAAARPAAPTSAAAMRSAARRSQAQLTVWPHLLMPEFMASVLLVIGFTVMAWFINAPLEEHSNPNHTPNPSKAPWYFLNLQELLLHMHPALAGVIVPTIVLLLLMVIPYLDVTTDEIGVWFSGPRGKRVAWISNIYTLVTTIGLIVIDKMVGIRAVVEAAIPILRTSWISEIVTQTMLPTTIMWVVAVGLYLVIAHMRPTVREVMIAYFTAFAVAWVLMAIIGSAFRGQAMNLYWPWDPGMTRVP